MWRRILTAVDNSPEKRLNPEQGIRYRPELDKRHIRGYGRITFFLFLHEHFLLGQLCITSPRNDPPYRAGKAPSGKRLSHSIFESQQNA